MNTSDTIFQRALSKLLTEIFDGPPGDEAYLLNPGDPGRPHGVSPGRDQANPSRNG